MRSSGSAWALAAALAGVAFTGCGGDDSEGAEEAATIAAEVGTVAVRDFAVTVTALGTVSAKPGSAARIAAPGESFVTAVRVGPGDRVSAGSPLVELDRSVWEAQAREADAGLSAADEAWARARRLVEQGILPRKELEAATAEQARARAAAADAQRNLGRAVLRSPIDGVVASIEAALSQPVAANDVLVEVVSDAGLEALLQLAPENAAQVAAGATVELSAGLDPSAAPVAAGTVKGVSSAVDPASGTVTVRVALTSVQRPLRPGQTVSARITVGMHASAVVVPREAVVPVTNGVVVFVADADGVVHATPVVLGAEGADSVEVTSGLVGGERVVTVGAYGMVDGAHIQPAGTR